MDLKSPLLVIEKNKEGAAVAEPAANAAASPAEAPPAAPQWKFDLTMGNDLVLMPLHTKLCNLCTVLCLVSFVYVHLSYEYSERRHAVTWEEDPWTPWCLQWTATVSLVGLAFELSVAICIKIMRLEELYTNDLVFMRRLLLNRKMIFAFTWLTLMYHLMAFNQQVVHVGWLADYYGGEQIVYSMRYMEWIICAPVVLSCQGQLSHSEDGKPRNSLIPSSLLTGVYCATAWQALVVADVYAAWWLLIVSFFAYYCCSVEQLAYAKVLWKEGRSGSLRAGLLIYLVVMMGVYGIVYLMPIPGWISPTWENKFYCFGDASFKIGTSIMLLASNDLANNAEMLRRAESIAQDLQSLIDTASVPIFSMDIHGKIFEWNNQIAKLTGVPKEVAFGVPVKHVLGHTTQADGSDVLQLALSGKDTQCLETQIFPHSVEEFEHLQGTAPAKLALSTACRRDKYGGLAAVTFIGYDLTEISAYREAEERKKRFLAVVTHELRSPLHGILGLLQFLIEGEGDDKKLRFLTMIKSCATRLLDLVVNIMEMATLTGSRTGKAAVAQKLSRDPVDLNRILEEIVHLVRNSVDKRNKPLLRPGVTLTNIMEEVPVLEGDAHRCTQVFYNLVTNACKFTPKGKIEISSSVDVDGQWVDITVSDTGKGIAPSSLTRIFEPFEQEDNSVERSFEGVGLGLPIASEVVKMHGGHIRVMSALEAGSQFIVRLPIQMREKPLPVDGAARSAAATHESLPPMNDSGDKDDEESKTPQKIASKELKAPKGPAARLHLLSVDDDPLNHEVIKNNLGEVYDITVVMDGKSAIEYLEDSSNSFPDAILLDYMMPGMSGIEVARIVREEMDIGPIKLPIVMVSASDKDTTMMEALNAGCCAYVSKPFYKGLLMAQLRACLRSSGKVS
eukprot:TRINITY_DN29122_c0_g1_i1.p1 TRINITY_DN29122_c0_g1~~TRINITY_DN29122_c0_g1_i1.p1  ORF type:complete len:901 (+),score=207.27 TRINITY_DN29122_c0_g1_i1:112-2814(+)